MRTEHRDQASFSAFALREVSVLAELALGHLRYSLTDVPVKLPAWQGPRIRSRGSTIGERPRPNATLTRLAQEHRDGRDMNPRRTEEIPHTRPVIGDQIKIVEGEPTPDLIPSASHEALQVPRRRAGQDLHRYRGNCMTHLHARTQNHSLAPDELVSHVLSPESLAPGTFSIQSHRF
ncbi:unnamed protein product [Trichogramma brassicae]|uniref:Uncharacterized protein n=1 Tax=Trichogramma brassicae TaxID=86971 RepID=A0A6H5IAD6_9HYME|nr:unnamed protein product [Trichogramma brassicae]